HQSSAPASTIRISTPPEAAGRAQDRPAGAITMTRVRFAVTVTVVPGRTRVPGAGDSATTEPRSCPDPVHRIAGSRPCRVRTRSAWGRVSTTTLGTRTNSGLKVGETETGCRVSVAVAEGNSSVLGHS